MSAGARFEYHWQDGVNFKKPTKVSAPEYVDYLMDWVQKQLDDDAIFPSQIGACQATLSLISIQWLISLTLSLFS